MPVPQPDPGLLLCQVRFGPDRPGPRPVHTVCQYAGVEEEYNKAGKLVCPKCQQVLRTTGQDFTSMGVLRKCRDCGEVFGHPAIKWRCLKCGAVVPEDKALEVDAYTYTLTKKEEVRLTLTFEMNHKPG